MLKQVMYASHQYQRGVVQDLNTQMLPCISIALHQKEEHSHTIGSGAKRSLRGEESAGLQTQLNFPQSALEEHGWPTAEVTLHFPGAFPPFGKSGLKKSSASGKMSSAFVTPSSKS